MSNMCFVKIIHKVAKADGSETTIIAENASAEEAAKEIRVVLSKLWSPAEVTLGKG